MKRSTKVALVVGGAVLVLAAFSPIGWAGPAFALGVPAGFAVGPAMNPPTCEEIVDSIVAQIQRKSSASPEWNDPEAVELARQFMRLQMCPAGR